MARYDVNAAWSDPFETKVDHRSAERFKFRIKISMLVQNTNPPQRLVGPGIVRNISATGAWVLTKHALQPGQKITIAIPTKRFSVAEYLPATFIGPAEIVRIKPDVENRMWAGIRFGEPLLQNMEFAAFIKGLYSLREALTQKD